MSRLVAFGPVLLLLGVFAWQRWKLYQERKRNRAELEAFSGQFVRPSGSVAPTDGETT